MGYMGKGKGVGTMTWTDLHGRRRWLGESLQLPPASSPRPDGPPPTGRLEEELDREIEMWYSDRDKRTGAAVCMHDHTIVYLHVVAQWDFRDRKTRGKIILFCAAHTIFNKIFLWNTIQTQTLTYTCTYSPLWTHTRTAYPYEHLRLTESAGQVLWLRRSHHRRLAVDGNVSPPTE